MKTVSKGAISVKKAAASKRHFQTKNNATIWAAILVLLPQQATIIGGGNQFAKEKSLEYLPSTGLHSEI